MKLGIICALSDEARTLHPGRILPGQQVDLDEKVVLTVSGMGQEGASASAQNLLKSNVTALLSWGTAAALDPRLEQGNLILPRTTISTKGDALQCDSEWHTAVSLILRDSRNIIEGNIAEADTVLSTAQQKAALMHSTGAIAADMESAAIGKVAVSNCIPYLVIRCVTDTSNMSIPGALLGAIDEAGQMPVSKILTQVLLKPSVWPSVARLARGMRKSTLALKQIRYELGNELGCPHY